MERYGSVMGCCGVLWSITEHYGVLHDVTEHYTRIADHYGTLQSSYITVMENIDFVYH